MKKVLFFLMVVLATGTSHDAFSQAPIRPGPQPAAETGEKFKIGIAGFTFANFPLDKALETLQKVDVHYLCIKDFHLPLNSTDEQIAAFHAKCKEKGVTGYAVGPIYMKSEAEIDKAFEYAKKVGVKLIIGIPTMNYCLM